MVLEELVRGFKKCQGNLSDGTKWSQLNEFFVNGEKFQSAWFQSIILIQIPDFPQTGLWSLVFLADIIIYSLTCSFTGYLKL